MSEGSFLTALHTIIQYNSIYRHVRSPTFPEEFPAPGAAANDTGARLEAF